jgi:hypothetical protein
MVVESVSCLTCHQRIGETTWAELEKGGLMLPALRSGERWVSESL